MTVNEELKPIHADAGHSYITIQQHIVPELDESDSKCYPSS